MRLEGRAGPRGPGPQMKAWTSRDSFPLTTGSLLSKCSPKSITRSTAYTPFRPVHMWLSMNWHGALCHHYAPGRVILKPFSKLEDPTLQGGRSEVCVPGQDDSEVPLHTLGPRQNQRVLASRKQRTWAPHCAQRTGPHGSQAGFPESCGITAAGCLSMHAHSHMWSLCLCMCASVTGPQMTATSPQAGACSPCRA